MANEMLDNPLSFIENTVGLQNAPNVFHFGQEFTGPTSKWPYEDPNQLKLDLKEAIQKKLQEEINNSQLPGIISINNETFYHQTSEPQAQSILQNGFHVHMHDGQARFTHGIYFLNHPEGHFGETTLTANVSGNFIDFTNDEMGDAWLALKSSYNWNNYVDLTLAIQKDFPNADGLVFNNKYMCVVWYPEKCISDIQLT